MSRPGDHTAIDALALSQGLAGTYGFPNSLRLALVGTQWHYSTDPPFRPAHGSQPGAQAGRHALEGQGHFLTLLGAATDILLVISKSRAVFWQPAHLRGVALIGTNWQHFSAALCRPADWTVVAI